MTPRAQAPAATVSWALAERRHVAAKALSASALPANVQPTNVQPANIQPANALPAEDLQLLLSAVRQRLQASARAALPGEALALVVLDCVQALQLLQGLLDLPHHAACSAAAGQAGP